MAHPLDPNPRRLGASRGADGAGITSAGSSAIAPRAARAAIDPVAAATAAEGRATARRDAVRRSGAALLSALVPGLGQLANGRWRPAALFFLPVAAVAIVAVGILRTGQHARLLAWVVDPAVLHALLGLSLAVLAVRLLAVLHAFFDRRYGTRPSVASIAVLALALGLVALPHAVAQWYGGQAEAAFGRFFSGTAGQASATFLAPRDEERLNVLVVGIDKTPERTATLTDTMMLVSLDRRTGGVSLVSIPRDLVDVPLGNGDTFVPKLNSLYAYAERHRDAFPAGGMRALEDAVGALFGIRVHAYAELDFSAFVRVVDLAGGVDVHVDRAIEDPDYPGYEGGPRGFAMPVGDHHLDGVTALAYARSRKGLGDSDFTRAGRQQEILVALKAKLARSGSLFTQLPELLDIFGDTVRTDLPPSLLPGLAAIVDGTGARGIDRVVIRKPLVHGEHRSPLGSVQVPDVQAIQAMVRAVLPAPGTAPSPWPPAPSAKPRPASPAPVASP